MAEVNKPWITLNKRPYGSYMSWKQVRPIVHTVQKLELETTTDDFNGRNATFFRDTTWPLLTELTLIVRGGSVYPHLFTLNGGRFPVLADLTLNGVALNGTLASPMSLRSLSLRSPASQNSITFNQFAEFINDTPSLERLHLDGFPPLASASTDVKIHLPNLRSLYVRDRPKLAGSFLNFNLLRMPPDTTIVHRYDSLLYDHRIPNTINPFLTMLPMYNHLRVEPAGTFDRGTVGITCGGVWLSLQSLRDPSKRLRLHVETGHWFCEGPIGQPDVPLTRFLAHAQEANVKLTSSSPVPIKTLVVVSKHAGRGATLDAISRETWSWVLSFFPAVDHLDIEDVPSGATVQTILGLLCRPGDVHGARASLFGPSVRELTLRSNVWQPPSGRNVRIVPFLLDFLQARAQANLMLQRMDIVDEFSSGKCWDDYKPIQRFLPAPASKHDRAQLFYESPRNAKRAY